MRKLSFSLALAAASLVVELATAATGLEVSEDKLTLALRASPKDVAGLKRDDPVHLQQGGGRAHLVLAGGRRRCRSLGSRS